MLTGWLGGRYPKHILLGLLYILRSVMFAAYFVMPPTPASTLLFAAAMGMLWWPGLAPLIGGLVAEIFGTRYMATLLGMSFVVHQVGSSLGAWGGGLIFDLSGSYDRAWQIGTLIGFAAGVVQILAGGPTRRHDRMIVPAVATDVIFGYPAGTPGLTGSGFTPALFSRAPADIGSCAQPLAGEREHRIADRRRDRGTPISPMPVGGLSVVDDLGVDLRHVAHAQHLVVVEVRLLDRAVLTVSSSISAADSP